jgi:hypothetical protein
VNRYVDAQMESRTWQIGMVKVTRVVEMAMRRPLDIKSPTAPESDRWIQV